MSKGPGKRPGKNSEPGGTGAVLGVRLIRYAGVQGASLVLSNAVQLISIAVVANFLGPSDLGRFALLLFLAGIVTVILSIACKPGTIRRVFGAADDEDDDDDEDDKEVSESPQRSLGVGLLFAFVLGAAGGGALILAAAPVADALLGTRSDADLVVWAGVAVVFWVPFKLASITIWLERRPTAYVVGDASRPVLGLIALSILLATGSGVEGAIAGTAIGTAVAAVFCIFLLRHSFEPSADLAEVWQIALRGRQRAPIVMSFWTVQNADVFLLSRVVSDTDLGIYALASRLGFVVSFLPQGFRVAMRPLRKSAMFQAVRDEYGQSTQRGQLLGYFFLLCIFAVLLMILLGKVVVEIAPPEYADAAALIPFTAAALVMPVLYRTINGNVMVPHKRATFIIGCVLATVVFAALTLLLAPEIGTYAAPVGIFVGFAIPASFLFLRCQLGPRPIDFPYRAVLKSFVLAAAVAGGFLVLPDLSVVLHGLIGLALLALYVASLVLFRVIPENHWQPLMHMARSTVRGTTHARFNPRAGLRAIPQPQRKQLRRAVKRRLPAEELRDGEGTELVGILRRLGSEAGIPMVAEPTHLDGEIAIFLFEKAPIAVRDASMRRVLAAGAKSNDLRALEDLVAHLVRVPNEAWRGEKKG